MKRMARRRQWQRQARGRDSRPRPESRAAFAGRALGVWALVAIVTWQGVPLAARLWTDLQRTSGERAADEASAWYPNCDAARAAGAAPIQRGEPGYREALDRDGDGIACEPFRG